MEQTPSPSTIASTIKGAIIAICSLVVFVGCTTGRDGNPQAALEDFKAGDAVWVCGCPMTCCNIVARTPKSERCPCNFPLKRTTVTRVEGGKVFVKVSGREKSFFITSR